MSFGDIIQPRILPKQYGHAITYTCSPIFTMSSLNNVLAYIFCVFLPFRNQMYVMYP